MPEISQEILIWARETSELTVEDATKKLQLRDTTTTTGAQKLLEYESGKASSRSLLLKMSKQYRKLLLTFYLEKPPRKGNRGEDFRTLRNDYNDEEDVCVDVFYFGS